MQKTSIQIIAKFSIFDDTIDLKEKHNPITLPKNYFKSKML